MNNFAISGTGRSGTTFLSLQLDKSPEWLVLHEPPPKYEGISVDKVQGRFNQDKYGEVNSYLRWSLKDLNVKKKGVILRDPRNIIRSTFNSRLVMTGDWMDYQIGMIEEADRLRQIPGIFVFKFEDMVVDKDYIMDIASAMGVDDLSREDISLEKINHRKICKYKNFNDIPLEFRNYVLPKIEKYIVEWGYN